MQICQKSLFYCFSNLGVYIKDNLLSSRTEKRISLLQYTYITKTYLILKK